MIEPSAQDYLNAVQRQRDDALNQAANLAAEVAALRRALAERDERIAALAGRET